jgi:hypothetical protein
VLHRLQAVAQSIVSSGLIDYYKRRDAMPEQAREAMPDELKDLGPPDHPDKGFVKPSASMSARPR